MKILTLDPSGSFKEGKGVTGWVILNNQQIESFGQIKAKDFDSREAYWHHHETLWKNKDIDIVVIENFKLYSSKVKPQINSEMETSKLLGYLEMKLWEAKIECTMQMAVQAKKRYTDKILLHKKYIQKDGNGRYFINGVNVSKHIIDALRHALFFDLKSRKKKKA